MNKKFILGFAVVVLLFVGTKAWALDYTYTESGEQITITGYTGPGGDVVIPDAIEGMPVVTIGGSAFANSNLTSVIIADSVTSIGFRAFVGCIGLTSVIISNSVTTILDQAFDHCSSLIDITVDVNNAHYSSLDGVLFNKEKTELIKCPGGKVGGYSIPGSVTSIGNRAFEECRSLTGVTIPSSVTHIELAAFASCSGLTSVTIPGSVASFGSHAFRECSSLTSVTIENGVTSIGDSAFYLCDSLTSVDIGNSVTTIQSYAFNSCANLDSVTIPDSVTSIGYSAFSNCSRLTSVDIGNGVTTILEGAFENCTNLPRVVIPASVTDITFAAFENCSSLEAAYFLGNAPVMGYFPWGWDPVFGPVFIDNAPDFQVCYTPDATGFSSPLWEPNELSSYPAAPCARACSYDIDCADHEFCENGVCLVPQPTDCAVDGDCDDGVFCNGAEECIGGVCHEGSSPCLAGELCSEAEGLCAECFNDGDCPAGSRCVEGQCMEPFSCNLNYLTPIESPVIVATDETFKTYTSAAEMLINICGGVGTMQEVLDTCTDGCCYIYCPGSPETPITACIGTDGELCYTGGYCVPWDVTCEGYCDSDSDCLDGYECASGSCEIIIDAPPTITAGPYLAAGSWPVLPTTSSPESPMYLQQSYNVLWTFSDDYASCPNEDCTHVAEYQAIDDATWTGLDVTSDDNQGMAYIELPINNLLNATTYAFRFSVTDCATQSAQSQTYYFRVATEDNPPVIDAGPFLAAGTWPALSKAELRAFVIAQDEYVLWSFDDDYATCSDMTWHRARYHRIVDDGTWIWEWLDVRTDSTEKEFAYARIPASSMEAGTYRFVAEIIDCAGQLTRSTTSYFKVESPQ